MNVRTRPLRAKPRPRHAGARLSSLLLAGTLFGVGPGAHATDEVRTDAPPSVTQAGADFQLYCADCHGQDARGRGPKAYDLERALPDLTTLTARHHGVFPREEVLRMIDGRTSIPAHDTRAMPAWGNPLKLEAGEGLGGGAGEEQVVRDRLRGLVELLEQWQR